MTEKKVTNQIKKLIKVIQLKNGNKMHKKLNIFRLKIHKGAGI